jgi:hypothetical protein
MAVGILFAAMLGYSSACASDELPKPARVRSEFNAALKPGDPSEKIEAYFKGRSLEFDYDKYQHRYQSTMRSTKSNFHAISIYVNVDKERRFESVDAFDSYTTP